MSLVLCLAAATAVVLERRCTGGRRGPTLAAVRVPQCMWLGQGAGGRAVFSDDQNGVGFYDGRLTTWCILAVPCLDEDHRTAHWESVGPTAGPGLAPPATVGLAVAAAIWPACWAWLTWHRPRVQPSGDTAPPPARPPRLSVTADVVAALLLLACVAAVVAIFMERGSTARGAGYGLSVTRARPRMVIVKDGRRGTTVYPVVEQYAAGYRDSMLTVYAIWRLDVIVDPAHHAALYDPNVFFPHRGLTSAWTAGLAVLLGAWPVVRARTRWRWWHRPRAGLCPACGYDLRATPGRCPECGRMAG